MRTAYTTQRAIFYCNTTVISFLEKGMKSAKFLLRRRFLSPSSLRFPLLLSFCVFFLLFINDSDCCATKENAFFQIDSCPVNDNDPLFDGDGQGQQPTL
jgi:hypothetical protein